MITLRCTRRLLARLVADAGEPDPMNALGDWYANPIIARPRQLALYTNERTLLSVVVPIAPMSGLIDRFRRAGMAREVSHRRQLRDSRAGG